MANILRPNIQNTLLRGVRPDAGVSAAEVAASAGDVEISAGQSIANFGIKMLQHTDAALQASVLSTHLSDAQLALNTQVQERTNKIVDENGNPTYPTLVEDIGKIGEDLKKQYSKKLYNPALSSQFNKRFNAQIENQQLMGLSQARKQQHQFGITALDDSLSKNLSSAYSDNPENIDSYVTNADMYINSALHSGIISPIEAEKYQQKNHIDIVKLQYTRQMQTDPKQVLESLKNDQHGLDPFEVETIKRRAQAAIEDRAKDARRVQAENEKAEKEVLDLNVLQLETAIMNNDAGAAEIEAAFPPNERTLATSLGRYKEKKRLQLIKKLTETDKTASIVNKINDYITQGRPLYSFTGAQISKHYANVINRNEKATGKPTPFLSNDGPSKTLIAAGYPVDVPAYRQELSARLNSENNQDTLEALQAIDYLQIKNPSILRNMSRDDLAIAALTKTLRGGTNLSPKQAMERAKKFINEPTRDYSFQFKKEKDFDADHIEKTIASDFDVSGFSIDNHTLATIKEIYRSSYDLVGDAEAARELTKNLVTGLYGKTEFNEEKGWFNDKEKFMKLPPEVFNSDVDALKKDFHNSVKDVLPKGVTNKDLIIDSDYLTTVSNPTYAVSYRDKSGLLMPLMDKEGRIVRWKVPIDESEDARKPLTQERLEELRDKQLEKVRINQAIDERSERIATSVGFLREQPTHTAATAEVVQKDIQENGADPNDLGDPFEDRKLPEVIEPVSPATPAEEFTTLNNRLVDFTKQHLSLSYIFGSKTIQNRGIDSSGWVKMLLTEMAQNLKGFDAKHLSMLLATAGANQIRNVQLKVDPTNYDVAMALPGMLIGISRYTTPSWARNRYGNITQTGVIVEQDGRKMVSQSGGDTKGVGLVPLNVYLGNNIRDQYIVDPFSKGRK